MTRRLLLLGLVAASLALGCNLIAGLDELDKQGASPPAAPRFQGGFVAGAAEGSAGDVHLRGVLSWQGAARGRSADGAVALTGVLR
ncbi:hypothetical protein [Sorangium sp. So ce131]|uniref:hypothetical protein n=1 Tax=Sorangium sp. So ce131 TaxID=3133282 RepID=UPI003F6358EE